MSEPIIALRLPETIGPGRHRAPISAVQLSAYLTATIDAWAEDHRVSRSEAIRGLVQPGLSKSAPSERLKAAQRNVSAAAGLKAKR